MSKSFIILALVFFSLQPAILLAGEYELEVLKSERMLLVKKGSKIEKRYPMASGRGGRGDKRRSGDGRTPIGTYRIVDFNANSQFHFFMHLNYPNVKDAFWGFKENVITRHEFDRIISALQQRTLPPQDTRLGGLIGIHGIGDVSKRKLRIHDSLDWTEGCIALTNEAINDLRRYVAVGTKVLIKQ